MNNWAKVDGWKLSAPNRIHERAPFMAGSNNGITSKINIPQKPYCNNFLFLKNSCGIATLKNKNAT